MHVAHIKRILVKYLLQEAPAAEQPAFHGADGHPEHFTDLGVAKALEITEDYCLAEGFIQLVHRTEHLAGPRRRLADFLEGVVRQAAQAGAVRTDIAPAELAAFCLQALSPSPTSGPGARSRRLRVVLDGLSPSAAPAVPGS